MPLSDEEYTTLLHKELTTYRGIGIPKELTTLKLQVEIVLHPYAHCVYAHSQYHTSAQALWDTLIERKMRRCMPRSTFPPRAESIEEYEARGGIIAKINPETNKEILPDLNILLKGK